MSNTGDDDKKLKLFTDGPWTNGHCQEMTRMLAWKQRG